MKPIDDVQAILTHLDINDPRIIPTLEKLWQDKNCIIWGTDDVIEHIKHCKKVTLTLEQARKVLEAVFDNHDASIGISWDVLETHYEILCDDGGLELNDND